MLAALALPQLAVAVNGLVSPAAASGVKGLRKSGGIVSAGKKAGTSVGPAQPSEPDVRQPTGPLPFTSDNASAAADEAVLRWLQASTPSLTLPDPPPAPTPASVAAAAELGAEVGPVTRDSVLGLRLQARDVAKVVQDAVTHLAWHPAADRLLLAAGEKSGQVALWKVDDTPLPGGPEGFDGVLTF
ncbi:WD_REPEATS_REGION domain-containing protein, partial [Haematococcus lacustris]